MKLSFYIFIILSIIALFIDSAYSKSINISKKKKINKKEKNKGKEIEKKDQFYIITVKNPYVNDTTVDTKQKRDLNSIFIDEIVSDIHTLIVENKDTYESTEVLEELDNESEKRKKKRSNEKSNDNNGESNYVYPISSTRKHTVIYAYLSNDLAVKVDEMTNIESCEPELELETALFSYSNYQDEVKKDTGWDNVARRKNSKSNLSVVSQGKYDSSFINNYDDSYYYPETAGSGVDVFVIDLGFNFRSSEFTNISNRCSCLLYIKEGQKYYYEEGKDVCYSDNIAAEEDAAKNHGSILSDVIGGRTYGAAPKANIHGIVIHNNFKESDILAAVDAVKNYSSSKKVIVMSHMMMLPEAQRTGSSIKNLDELINEVAEKAVFVNCSGNNKVPIVDTKNDRIYYPCVLDSVICVGAIDNNVNDLITMNTNSYKMASYSNYGKEVNIYAPGSIYAAYQTYYSENTEGKKTGTSYAAGVAGGLVANIISEDGKGYGSKAMIQKLNSIGIKNVISGLPSGCNNVLLNNGKHIVYSKGNSYKNGVCGPSAGNRKCSSGCCSKYGYCGTTDDHCKSGCQSQFGTCK